MHGKHVFDEIKRMKLPMPLTGYIELEMHGNCVLTRDKTHGKMSFTDYGTACTYTTMLRCSASVL